jgi:hypothetical protein
MPKLMQSLAFLALGFLLAGPAGAQAVPVTWLPDGAEFTLQCKGSGPAERSWKVASKDGEARLERVGRDYAMQAPAWAILFIDIGNEFENGSPTKRMRQVAGAKDGLARLEPGMTLSAEYEWTRGNQSANRTHTVKVEEKKTVKTEVFGEQEVYVVTDTVTGRIHNMKLVTHYAPALGTYVYRSFENFNNRDRFECNLAKLKRS